MGSFVCLVWFFFNQSGRPTFQLQVQPCYRLVADLLPREGRGKGGGGQKGDM